MPELPEVETTKRGVTPALENKKITNVLINNPNLRWPIDTKLSQKLIGQSVLSVTRRGKYLIFDCGFLSFIVHLGMSGSLRLTPKGATYKKHDHVEVCFDNNICLRLNDPRRFGCFIVTDLPLEHKLLAKLGVEPLSPSFYANYLFERCQKRTVNIKQLIMNSEVVVGVGNIYANEALFLSGIHPLTSCNQLNKVQCLALIRNIKSVLRAAIKQGGTTLKDFTNAQGKPGYFQQTLLVYGRKDLPCVECGTLLREVRINGRSTIFCEYCQPMS